MKENQSDLPKIGARIIKSAAADQNYRGRSRSSRIRGIFIPENILKKRRQEKMTEKVRQMTNADRVVPFGSIKDRPLIF